MLFVVAFQEMNLLLTLFVGSQNFISLPTFMFVGAAVSELRESNQNKKEKEKKKNSEIEFKTFPGYNQR